MSKFRFEDLEIWQNAIEIADKLLELADDLEKKHLFRFAEQLRGSVLSISNHIAEGSGEGSKREFAKFYISFLIKRNDKAGSHELFLTMDTMIILLAASPTARRCFGRTLRLDDDFIARISFTDRSTDRFLGGFLRSGIRVVAVRRYVNFFTLLF